MRGMKATTASSAGMAHRRAPGFPSVQSVEDHGQEQAGEQGHEAGEAGRDGIAQHRKLGQDHLGERHPTDGRAVGIGRRGMEDGQRPAQAENEDGDGADGHHPGHGPPTEPEGPEYQDQHQRDSQIGAVLDQ